MKTIVNNNKLIAEFMDFPTSMLSGRVMRDVCKYHTLWDWLMPAVNKIEKLYEGRINVNIHNKNECSIHSPYFRDLNIHTEKDSKIEAVYYAVVEFIKWYNEKEKS